MLSSRVAVAVHILTLHALVPERFLSSSFVAGSVDTHPVVVRRLLGQLRKAGLVVAKTGVRGGTRLARPPAAIRLSEIYHAVEVGNVLALHRHPPNPACPVGGNIGAVLSKVFAKAERAFEGVLAETTLADVVVDLGRSGARHEE